MAIARLITVPDQEFELPTEIQQPAGCQRKVASSHGITETMN
ncbi:hypothetical protein ACPOL_1843 [Acidisarcina polymorpha]|uniref:Uncharacterized protein n=1 Tax=Acidisarcina polymorpha TaxID=2211140 RepID=A0A2Z5FWB7_9BACT|nr:hypothetical protein ACPOL_1843 [Acidisarcina polymorpha]